MQAGSSAAEKIVPINRAFQRASEAEALLIARVRLSQCRGLDDADYALRAMELRVQELAWAKRWKVG